MKRFISILLFLSFSALADDPVPETKEEESVEEFSNEVDGPSLLVGLRADLAYAFGLPVGQGFSLAGARVNIYGSATGPFDYLFSLAPTREFSSAQMPQVLPIDAWVRVRSANDATDRNGYRVKVGMMPPTFNPLWTNELAVLPLTDYGKVHSKLFLSREMGVELNFWMIPDHLEGTAGFFNGSGIVAQNSNNARAYTLSIGSHFQLLGGDLALMASAYYMEQADITSVNYVRRTIGDFSLLWRYGKSTFEIDVGGGRLDDATTRSTAVGVSGVLNVAFLESVSWYLRAEALRYRDSSPLPLNRIQTGPCFELSKELKLFAFAEHLDYGSSPGENSGQILIRLAL